MRQVAEWLEQLGMSEYTPCFAQNDIDFLLLPELTDQDLEKIGVASLGHRRKILKAIVALTGGKSAEPPAVLEPTHSVPPQPAAVIRPAAREPAGERRYVTVMFCDLVGSTGISAQLDAEEWRDLVGAYLDAACTAVTEMGGHVAKKLGDGLMVLFGYPVAQENDAERAARAALSIQRALAEVNRRNADAGKPALNARIGIEAGAVVVDAAGEIYGDAPNIAARVQALAEPGTVIITARVQHQVAGLFVVEERGRHELRGVPEPVMLYRLVRASGGGRRAGQRHLTPLVGREEEIAMLMRRWERARQGDGQLVMIVSEPGLGKSRLIDEFHALLREVPHSWVEWSCSQLLQNTPLHPIADWGRQRFGGADMSAEQRLADLENTLAQVGLDPTENAPLLAPLLGVALALDRSPKLEPEVLRRRQLTALTNFVMAGARTQPVVLAFEDVHWADPTTLELLRGVAERGALAPLFVLITARPEFRPPWGVRSHHSTISLAPLDRTQVRHMVGELAAHHALPKEVVEGVTERTGGVPLFVEEVTRLLLERGEQHGIQAIPPTLQQSLTARLDRLGRAREVAQIGAVIGRDFSYPLLRAVAGTEDVALQMALEQLAEADILLVQGLPPESEYRFKHVLLRDAAYENLLKSRRQVLHRRIGEALRDNFATTASGAPELIAHHFTQAGLAGAAIEWWGEAGQRSLERSALVEAITQLKRALDLIVSLPTTPVLRRQEIKFQVALITPLLNVNGYTAPETKAAAERARLLIERAEALGESPEDPLLLFSVLYGLWTTNLVAFNRDVCRNFAADFLTHAEEQRVRAPLMVGHRLMGMSLMYAGDVAQGRTHYDQAIALYDASEDRPLATRFGVDNRVSALSVRAQAMWILGYPDRARSDVDDAIADAREIDQSPSLMYALVHMSLPLLFNGDYATARSVLNEVAVLAHAMGSLFWKTYGMLHQACLLTMTGNAADAVTTFIAGLAVWRSLGPTLNVPLYLGYLAKAHAELDQTDDAWRCVGEAMTAIETTEQRLWEAEVNRLAGEVALKSRELGRTELYFERALEVARRQKAKSCELRAAMSMARLWHDQGKPQQARELLAPVYRWFTEGFDTRDLREAKALLDALS